MNPFIDEHPRVESVRQAVLDGLAQTPRSLPPRLFYDDEGSRLFEAITRLPEYYLTRTEIAILRANARDMVGRMRPNAMMIEYGSGSSRKTDILLREFPADATYVPVDISREHLLEAAARVSGTFPSLTVLPVCADYSMPLPGLASYVRGRQATVFFPGSTIGNYEPEHAVAFLRSIHDLVGAGGGLLIGIDLRKEVALLEAAYNDAYGVTAEFNLNMLRHINRRLGKTFDVDRFRHHAFWNEEAGRIEMHLVTEVTQPIRIGHAEFTVRAGDSIVTEYSYKYALEEARALLDGAGFEPEHVWLDADAYFSVHYARAG